MTRDELRATVLAVLGTIDPDVDASRVPEDAVLRDSLDLDSMDVLNFVIALHERLHVDIPEMDYPKLATLAGCVDYLWRARSPR